MGRKFAAACNRELGAELRKRREGAGLTGQHMASHMGWNVTTVSRVETGQADISLVDMVHYLGACKVCLPDIKELRKLCETAERNLGYWLSPNETLTSLVFHESMASQSISYQPFIIPGLLQTDAYAKARMSRWSHPPAQIDAFARARMERQRVLRRPARFVFFVQEHALRLRMGSASVMHEQLLHLVLMSSLNHHQQGVGHQSGSRGRRSEDWIHSAAHRRGPV